MQLKDDMSRYVYLILCISLVACCWSCSTTKYVGHDEYLLDKVDLSVDDRRIKADDLRSYLRQQPNYKVFGILKWPLYVYSWSGRNEKRWFNKLLRRIGEPPEILDTTLVGPSRDELHRYMINKGFIRADVHYAIDTSKYKKATVHYTITAGEPYRIREYRTRVNDARIDSIFHLKVSKVSWLKGLFRPASEEYTPLVQPGNLFDRDVLDQERQRITMLLRRRGYYAFNRDYIYFRADSLQNQQLVDLDLHLKPFRSVMPSDSTKERPHRRYYLNKVSVVTGYDPLSQEYTHIVPVDSVWKRNVWIYHSTRKHRLRPRVLARCCYLLPGQLYSDRNMELTYSAFANLGAMRHVNIRYDEREENDTLKLDCTILTAPAQTQGFGIEIEGTNSSGDLGFASSLNYQHRNLFGGSELFTAKVRGAYEVLSGGNSQAGWGSYWEFAGEASMLFPTFVFPFTSYDFRRKVRATTEFKFSYDQQHRPEYRRAILSGGWNYIWQNRTNNLARHTFKLLDVDYIYMLHVDTAFRNTLPEITAKYNYSDLFIVSSGYTYSFNNYDPMKRGRSTYSLRLSVELAGNILYGLSNLLNKKDADGRYKLFGTHYSQFVKGDIDFARSLTIDNRNSFAFHLGAGIGYPYGNSKELPFTRRYFAGGANSNRGWSVRSLGPGSMPVTDATTFVNQVGDLRLDANLEYRTKLFWKIELAAYIDAGNIWTVRKYDYQPQGNFDLTRFYKEIALSYGLGVRLDFDYFLIRLDTGMKAYNPQEIGHRKWAITRPNLTDRFAWHFAVGYPF